MKKIILGMSAMALMFTTSCCGSSSCDATNDSCIVNGGLPTSILKITRGILLEL